MGQSTAKLYAGYTMHVTESTARNALAGAKQAGHRQKSERHDGNMSAHATPQRPTSIAHQSSFVVAVL